MTQEFTRREFLKTSVKLSIIMGLGTSAVPKIAQAIKMLSSGNPPVLWLQGLSCSGCSVSLLNAEEPGPVQLLTRYISLVAHSTISTATGKNFMNVVDKSINSGDYFLVTEGSVPAGMPKACIIGHQLYTKQLAKAAKNAKAIITLGTCSSFGGIPAAENNPTGAVSVPDFLKKEMIDKPLIRLPGCPGHPDWLVGTLVHILKFGIPILDSKNRPKMFYSKLIHDHCQRFSDYEKENFATTFSGDGCLFKLGCIGPNTHADCTIRFWNSKTNTCINAGAPCIGCASEAFAKDSSFPFYRKGEHIIKKEDS